MQDRELWQIDEAIKQLMAFDEIAEICVKPGPKGGRPT